MKVCFMGTPEFGAVSLQALIDAGHEVAAVFTQPDRPKGRGNKMLFSPVKEVAVRYGIPVYQPEKISRESVEVLRELAPDVCVTAAFGQFLSETLLAIPKHGTINVHASLLPKHRGSAPINWSIINGDPVTGVTTMMTVRKMDAGDILLKSETEIGENETAGALTDRLARMGADLLIRTLSMISEGNCPRTPQNEDEMTYEPMLTKEIGKIDWSADAFKVHRLICGTSPWPGAFTTINSETVKIHASLIRNDFTAEAGSIVSADRKNGLVIACGKGAIEITELQMPGGKRMMAKDYFLGHTINSDKAGN